MDGSHLPAPAASEQIGERARRLPRRLADLLLGKIVTLLLAATALGLGFATFVVLAHGSPFGLKPGVGVGMVLANLSVLLVLGAVLAGRLTRIWVERRRGSAGCRLHVRLVRLVGGVAGATTMLVATNGVKFSQCDKQK